MDQQRSTPVLGAEWVSTHVQPHGQVAESSFDWTLSKPRVQVRAHLERPCFFWGQG